MHKVILGRTGIEVGVAGLGCGGHSRLGQDQGKSVDESIRLVREAIDLGINYIDTARQYGTEEIVGRAVEGRREEVIISTKAQPCRRDVLPDGTRDETRFDAAKMRELIEESLRKLRVDTIDVFHLHGVSPELYDYVVAELLPELEYQRDKGAIRFLALSERFAQDLTHEMAQRAAVDGYFDVMMVGFNMLNPSARHRLFPATLEHNIGIEIMYAVRNVLSNKEALVKAVGTLVKGGLIDADDMDLSDPLGFLIHDDGARSVIDAAYRFVRHEPGAHVVLTGTGDVEHLKSNIASINGAALPVEDRQRLQRLFGDLAALTGE